MVGHSSKRFAREENATTGTMAELKIQPCRHNGTVGPQTFGKNTLVKATNKLLLHKTAEK